MTDIKISYSESDTKGHYSAHHLNVQEEGELTISKVSERLVIADHTFVPDALRGKGVAKALTERLISDARAHDQRIVPLCPFVRSYAEKRREELTDVIQW